MPRTLFTPRFHSSLPLPLVPSPFFLCRYWISLAHAPANLNPLANLSTRVFVRVSGGQAESSSGKYRREERNNISTELTLGIIMEGFGLKLLLYLIDVEIFFDYEEMKQMMKRVNALIILSQYWILEK